MLKTKQNKTTIKGFKRPTTDLEIFATPTTDNVSYPENIYFLQMKKMVHKPTN